MNSGSSIYRILLNGAGGFGGSVGGGGPSVIKPPPGASIDVNSRFGEGMVFAPRLSEGNGYSSNDSSLIDNSTASGQGVVTGTVNWTPGRFGPALNSPTLGTAAYVLWTHAKLKLDQPYSTEVWAYFRSFQTSSPFISCICTCQTITPSSWYTIRLGDAGIANNQIETLAGIVSTATLSASTIYQIVVTYDNIPASAHSGTVRLYVNGYLDSSAVNSPTAGQYTISTYAFRDDQFPSIRSPNGYIELLRHWQKCLSADDVLRLFQNPMLPYADDDWPLLLTTSGGGGGAGVNFRKSLSPLMGKVGRRQAIGA